MTETEATYKTEEGLPECETGSVERMLEAAMKWNQRTRAGLVIAVSERECARAATLMESQTKLLYNILAKMEQGKQPEHSECLPECETGSVEKMLEAAIQWSKDLEPGDGPLGSHVYNHRVWKERVPRVTVSQTKLLRNILAKMEQAQNVNMAPRCCVSYCPHCNGSMQTMCQKPEESQEHLMGWQRHANCPNCGASIRVTLEFSETTHG